MCCFVVTPQRITVWFLCCNGWDMHLDRAIAHAVCRKLGVLRWAVCIL
jgi:hypothetical protein